MTNPDANLLAKNLIQYSTELKAGEKVLIETVGRENVLTAALIRETYKAGAIPFVTLQDNVLMRELLTGCTKEQIEDMAKWQKARMEEMDAYIGIRAGENAFEMAAVPNDKMQLYNKYCQYPVHHEIRVAKTKWVVLRYPNNSMAQLAEMSTDDFSDFYYQVCNLDYNKMSSAMEPLINLMDKTKNVHLLGPGTNLRFSIEGISAIKCDGHRNIPDGEVYTAPVKNSVEGYITYNTPSLAQGITFNGIKFTFEQGKIIQAEAGANTASLNKILDTDDGARYIGEFALGVNPYILKPMKDTLFDEKIAGSFHFTPGACYDEASNGNQSAIHWDLVMIQRPEYGGGEIYFDNKLIRKDGIFVLPELAGLNPENLK